MADIFTEVIRQCNRFDGDVTELWEFRVLDNSRPVGYMREEYIDKLDWRCTDFRMSRKDKVIHLDPVVMQGGNRLEQCALHFVKLCQNNKSEFYGSLERWLGTTPDYHGIRWLDPGLGIIQIPAPLRGVFGVVTAGVHLNVYTVVNDGEKEERKLWVSKRSSRVTFAGGFDQIVAGGMDAEDGDNPLVTLQREARQEAGLTFDVHSMAMLQNGVQVGKVTGPHRISFWDFKDSFAGEEEGHLEPGMRYVFDLCVGPNFVASPNSEHAIDYFKLKSIADVETDILVGKWKPSSALATLDFLARTGFDAARVDLCLDDIKKALQRELPLRYK